MKISFVFICIFKKFGRKKQCKYASKLKSIAIELKRTGCLCNKTNSEGAFKEGSKIKEPRVWIDRASEMLK
jgi:hypothetical protein